MTRRIVISILSCLAAIVAAGAAYFHLRTPNQLPPEVIQVPMTRDAIARGEYLFTVVADCDGCHSLRDLSKFGGPVIERGRGQGFTFPPELGLPGKVTAPNITPDAETGIGAWTDGEKIRAIREGVSRDGRALFPMMPYQAFASMSDGDVRALVAYMNSLPAVRNPLPRTELQFPVNLLIKGAPAPVRNVSESKDLGKYLATLGGCVGCHTPAKNGAPIEGMEFAGGEPFVIGSFKSVSANITPDPDTGLGKMTETEFIERFHQYRKYAVDGPPPVTAENFTLMPWLSFSKLQGDELKAIYAELRKAKPVHHAVETHPSK